ncbi:MAG: carbohydrate kinase family protein [Anaerolineae bacterium]|nr:carbohydrate kinase family protein [Anaerolineae bacterium]
MPNDVLCYGDIALDNVMHVSHFPTPERSVVFHRESYHIGGTICNSAVCLASWGVPTTMALSYDLGEDDYADQLLKLLSAFPALDLSLVRRSPNTVTPYCRVLVIPDGERALLNYRYSEKADHELSIDLHRGEKYLIASIYGLARRFAALRAFRERGVTTVMGDIYWPDYPDLREIDIIINSASTLRGMDAAVDVRAATHALQQASGGIVITTDGDGPVYTVDRDGSWSIVQPYPVKAVDTTGAGDAFRGGIVYGLLQGWNLIDAVRWACAAGAIIVQQVGATNTATVEQTFALMEQVRLVEQGE